MNKQLSILLLAMELYCQTAMVSANADFRLSSEPSGYFTQTSSAQETGPIIELNAQLKSHLLIGDMDNCRRDADQILGYIKNNNAINDTTYSSTYYLIGIYYLLTKKFGEAIRYLELSASFREKKENYDEQYAKTIYNIGVAYSGIGDFISQEEYSEKSLAIEKKLYGANSPVLIKTYLGLTSANIGLQEYDKGLENSKAGLSLAQNNPGSADNNEVGDLYHNIGVIYMLLADYTKAKVYLEKTESLYSSNKYLNKEKYFNLLNSLAITYSNLGLSGKSTEYYEKGIKLARENNSLIAYNFIRSYALILGRNGNISKGESLVADALHRVKAGSQSDSLLYYSVLCYNADYMSEFRLDENKALEYFEKCVKFLGKDTRNLVLRDLVYLEYASALFTKGDLNSALEIIQSLLLHERNGQSAMNHITALYQNPPADSIAADKFSLEILRLKYQILWKIYDKTDDLRILEAASSTAKVIVEVLEKVRINISEDDSRLILGDRYRDSYLNAIKDFHLLYSLTADHRYLENAFEFAEKSKVAGLLAATRELNAAQFNIPAELSVLEKRIKRDINLRTAKIEEEMHSEHPDNFLINAWKENLLRNSEVRDSLIAVFEKKYPGYYSLKYNTEVTSLGEIPGLIGRNGNYVNYVLSDTVLFIFVANRKFHQLLSIRADSSFYSDIKEFRKQLGMPSPSSNARQNFNNFQTTGYRLYSKIIEPIRPYLISRTLVISPDNILSYIPFETIPISISRTESILYNKINYMMTEFDISYIYSATFLAESMKRESSFSNKLIAFAPNYSEPINIGAVLKKRQMVNGILPDLPYARQEAEYVSALTDGDLYENDNARETVYKDESGKYDIIHLAMHTILNDIEPMYSTLIFSSENDTLNDSYLNTYEIYSIPLKAKMVVLSSCNSGTGLLKSGEGILSLARGFMYSGSKSVVMAMWEIEDRTGTEIVEGFYDNLKRGYSKSSSLRKARIRYLNHSDQLRSHPYFWSSLVVYGNNSPLYFPKWIFIISGLAVALIAAFLGFYFWRRRYS